MSMRHYVSAIIIFAAGFLLSALLGSKPILPSAKCLVPAVIAQTAQSPSTLQRWEYRTVNKYNNKFNEIDTELNRLADQGFEVFWVTQSSPDLSVNVTILLRRPKQ